MFNLKLCYRNIKESKREKRQKERASGLPKQFQLLKNFKLASRSSSRFENLENKINLNNFDGQDILEVSKVLDGLLWKEARTLYLFGYFLAFSCSLKFSDVEG